MLNESNNKKPTSRNRIPSVARQGRNAPSTMNRPDSDTLNSNASATVAAQAFAQRTKGPDYNPAIANAIIPPVIEKKEEPVAKPSPFKNSRPPVKRTADASPFKPKEEDAASARPTNPNIKSPVKKYEGPQIAKFTPIPVLKEPESPFKPIGANNESNNGLKAPIKRPTSASVNHAVAKQQEKELERIKTELDAMGGARVEPKEEPVIDEAPVKEETAEKPAFTKPAFLKAEPAKEETKPIFAPPKTKTSDKTFVPLAPVPAFQKPAEEGEPSPFKPIEHKTEEQLRREEENARRALEQSRAEKKKSKLDRLMDELNRPIF